MKLHTPLLVLLVMFTYDVMGQAATDFECQQNFFYGSIGNGLHELELNSSAGTIIDHGLVAVPAVAQLSSVAYGNDITQGSSNRTFYSTSFLASVPRGILRWTGATWVYVLNDTLIYHNSAGFGSFIYFQHSGTPNQINDQRISRLNANGTLTPIFTDTSLAFTVADMAIDTTGNVYFFRGTSIGNTTELTVINPAGTILNSFSTTLNHLTTVFGMMFLNDTLYIGQGTTNSQIFPVIISGSIASLGSAIPMNISMNDLASCHAKFSEISGISEANLSGEIQVTFSDLANSIEVHNESDEPISISLFDMTGRLISSGQYSSGTSFLNANRISGGIYQLLIGTADGRYLKKKIAFVQ